MCLLILFMLYWTYLGCFIGHTYEQNTTNQGQRSESGWFSDVLQPGSSPTPTYGTINQPIEKQSRPTARDSVVNQWHAAPQTTPAQCPSSLAQPVYPNLPHYLPALVKPVISVPVCIGIRSKLLANECHVPSLTFGVNLQQRHDTSLPRWLQSHHSSPGRQTMSSRERAHTALRAMPGPTVWAANWLYRAQLTPTV